MYSGRLSRTEGSNSCFKRLKVEQKMKNSKIRAFNWIVKWEEYSLYLLLILFIFFEFQLWTYRSFNNDCPILFLEKMTWFPGHFNMGNLLLSGMCSQPGRLLIGRPDLKLTSPKWDTDKWGRRGNERSSIILPYLFQTPHKTRSFSFNYSNLYKCKFLAKNLSWIEIRGC